MVLMNPRPFTIEDALSVKALADRCPIRFSTDGGLLAYSVEHFQQQAGMREEMWVVDPGAFPSFNGIEGAGSVVAELFFKKAIGNK